MDRHKKTSLPELSLHLSRCAACRDYESRMARFEIYMKESACGKLSQAGIRQVEASVLKALDAFDFKKQPVRPRSKRWPVYAAAACFMILAGLSGRFYWTYQRNIQAAAAANDIFTAFHRNIAITAMLTAQPVRQEITEWVNDAQRAVVFVANCFPHGPSGTEIPGNQSPSTQDQ
ncbi:MAG: hypothetical protein FJ263_00255 [Planctomycetes bacterium]|nr:hypothetical protein [Planctomycetota bacterium]